MIALRPASGRSSSGPGRVVIAPAPPSISRSQGAPIRVRPDTPPECEAAAPSPHILTPCLVGGAEPNRANPACPGATMTTPLSGIAFADPAQGPSLERTAAALTAHGFAVQILDDAAPARERVEDLIPEGSTVLTGASETLRLSGIDADLNASGRYASVRARGMTLDRAKDAAETRGLLAGPDVAIGSVNAVTETGALVFASASGSQLPGYAGGAAHAIWVVGAQKGDPYLSTALSRIEDYVLPLESARVQGAHGGPSAVNRVLILNAEPHPGRGTVLLMREAIGY